MDKLISDQAQSEVSNRVKDILRALFINDWQSEPHKQQQNFAEQQYSTIKAKVNNIMNCVGAPAYTWLLCLMYVCFLFNHMAVASLGWRTPIELLTGMTPDISPLLYFYFYEPIFYKKHEYLYPSESNEGEGYYVGPAFNVGHQLCFKVLTKDTKQIIFRSAIRSALNPRHRNLRLIDQAGGETDRTDYVFIKSMHPENDELVDPITGYPKMMPGFAPDELIGRTYLKPPEPDGQRFRATLGALSRRSSGAMGSR